MTNFFANKSFITIFTPTYNRASLLPRLFDSLKRQTIFDFEWLIVDDGSSDETDRVVQNLCSLSFVPFRIRYYKKENGGKHTAINYGVNRALGELFFIADSDDILPPDALQTVLTVWNEVRANSRYAGICGLDGKMDDGSIIGSGISGSSKSDEMSLTNNRKLRYVDGTNIEVRFGMGVSGDMKEVFKTSILKEFPFPEIPNENFCPEVLVWNRIGIKYKLRYINCVIYLVEYQKEGITSSITKTRMNNPIATMMTYQEMTQYDIPMKWKIKAAINYWRFKECLKGRKNTGITPPSISWYWRLLWPLGWILHLRDVVTIK